MNAVDTNVRIYSGFISPLAMRFAFLILLVLLAWAVCACGSRPRERGPGLAAPGRPGLSVYLWVLDESTPVAARTDDKGVAQAAEARQAPQARPIPDSLAKYADRPIPFNAGEAGLWRANGLRLISVPVGDVPALRRSLRLTNRIQERWLGEAAAWTELAQGRHFEAPLPVTLDTGPVVLDPGVMRLLARAWIIPADAPTESQQARAALQLDLAVQHVPDPRVLPGTLEAFRPSPVVPLEEEGVLFTRLSLETALAGGDALVIIPEHPGAHPDAPPGPGEVRAWTMGPPAPADVLLGDALLSDLAGRGPSGGRVVIVLVPSVPATFGLSP